MDGGSCAVSFNCRSSRSTRAEGRPSGKEMEEAEAGGEQAEGTDAIAHRAHREQRQAPVSASVTAAAFGIGVSEAVGRAARGRPQAGDPPPDKRLRSL